MSYRRSRRKTIKAEINIVPFLDVLLVLLLIFMATAPIINQSVEVDLPNSVESQYVDNSQKMPTILEVSGVSLYSLSINNEKHEKLTAEQVKAFVKDKLIEDPQGVFLVAGAKDIPYEEVINALNLLHVVGIEKAGLMTNPL